MKRRKKLLTRRRRALRCAAAALVLLLLAQSLLHTALLLPIQAVRRSEDRLGVQGTRVIRRQWKPDLHNGTALFYLTANDRAVLLSDTFFDAQGWLPKSASLLDCTGGKPLHAGERIILLDAGEDAENRYYGTHLFSTAGWMTPPLRPWRSSSRRPPMTRRREGAPAEDRSPSPLPSSKRADAGTFSWITGCPSWSTSPGRTALLEGMPPGTPSRSSRSS